MQTKEASLCLGVGAGKCEGAGELVRKFPSLSQVGDQHQRNKGKKQHPSLGQRGKGDVWGKEEKCHTLK